MNDNPLPPNRRMPDQEWFRHTSWSADDRREFHARLDRCRSSANKAQYARIQASHILSSPSGSPSENAKSAIELLDMVINLWPTESELASANLQYAECLLILGKKDGAIERLRTTFELQRRFKKFRTKAHLTFGYLSAIEPLPHLYDEAIGALDEFKSIVLLPNDIFIDSSVRALIYEARGKHAQARMNAEAALNTVVMTRSGIAQHPSAGIVDPSRYPDLIKRLESIAH